MSEPANRVRWCLNKARRELAESGTHRGLVRQDGDTLAAIAHIKKAEHNLSAALFFERNGYSDWSPSAFFYCIYHCFLAILRKHGYESRNQNCTVAAVEMLKEQGRVEIGSGLIDTLKIACFDDSAHSAIQTREVFQYGTKTVFDEKERFEEFIRLSKEAIECAQNIVFS